MTFWTIILAGSIGGVVAGIFMLAVIMFGYWLNDRRRRR